MTTSVYLEGLPGTGKTSIMVSFAAALGERCLAVPETNPTAADRKVLRPHTSEDRTAWYLGRELRRDRLAAQLCDAPRPAVAVFDRSYLSVLAYCWASAAITRNPTSYRHALAVFDRDVRSHLTPEATIVLLTTTVGTSLHRRRDKADRHFERQWYRRDFLTALDEFYRCEAPQLAVGPLKILDTTGVSAAEILTSLGAAVDMGAAAIDGPAASLMSRRHGRDLRQPGLRHYYESQGGVQIFGQPLGEPVKHYAGTCQFFDRHALLLDDRGTIRPLDPAAAVDDRETA